MNRKKLKQYTHPSELIERWLTEHDFKQSWLAHVLRRPEKTMSEIMHKITKITPETALQIQEVTGIKATDLLQLQMKYDLEKAKAKRN